MGSQNLQKINKVPSLDPKIFFLVLPGTPGSSHGPPGCQSGCTRLSLVVLIGAPPCGNLTGPLRDTYGTGPLGIGLANFRRKPWDDTILYYTVLYYTILYCTILYYTILYCTILYCTILYYTILYYTILYYTVLYYTILYYTVLYYNLLHYYYDTLYYTILY